MTLQEWFAHIVKVCGLPAPPPLVLASKWNEAVARHQAEHPNCKECQARIRTIRALKGTQSPAASTGRRKR